MADRAGSRGAHRSRTRPRDPRPGRPSRAASRRTSTGRSSGLFDRKTNRLPAARRSGDRLDRAGQRRAAEVDRAVEIEDVAGVDAVRSAERPSTGARVCARRLAFMASSSRPLVGRRSAIAAASSIADRTSSGVQMPANQARSASVKRSRIRWPLYSAHAAASRLAGGSSSSNDALAPADPQRRGDPLGPRRAGCEIRPERRPAGSTTAGGSRLLPPIELEPVLRPSTRRPSCPSGRASPNAPTSGRASARATARPLESAAGSNVVEDALPSHRDGQSGDADLGAVETGRPASRAAAMSSRWLTVCSVPEIGDVLPAIPSASPLRVISSASVRWASRRGRSRGAPHRAARPRRRGTGRPRADPRSGPSRTAAARRQSAGAVNIAASSPTPARFSAGGASARTVRSTTRTSASGRASSASRR